MRRHHATSPVYLHPFSSDVVNLGRPRDALSFARRRARGAGARVRAEYAPRAESSPILNSHTSKNTPEHKDYIMDKRVVPVEE
jgi:hypothetical protein